MKLTFLFLLALVSFLSYAQTPSYVWPVGTKPALSANFGELRSNHYHMGLDARTEQRENLPVYAAEAGYIARIKIEPWGFGRAIYVNHPNGVTSLYAHLNDFYPALEKWVTEQQYKLQQWKVDLEVPASLFPVTKKQLIAYSGNTGGSMGPHLHFELRDTKTETVLNPLTHGFSVPDNIAPDIIRLAIYDRCVSTYEQSPRIIPLKRTGNTYKPAVDITVPTDKVSFGITSYDRYTGSTNQNGIYKAVLMHNNAEATRFVLDSISYDDTRFLNAHIDYTTKSRGGPYIQHLSRLPGHENSVYHGGDGVVDLEGTDFHEIRILVSDPAGNTSTIQFRIKSGETLSSPKAGSGTLFHPGMVNIFENEGVRFHLMENALYDSFRFTYKLLNTTNGKVHQVHNTSVPVHKYYTLNIFDDSFDDPGKVVMKRYSGSKTDFVKTSFSNGWYSGSFREFGNFQLVKDTIPPVISAVTKTATRISFTITDNTEELVNFTAMLNGKWLRFSNNKGRRFVYDIDDYCPKGTNELVITVEDLAGNTAEKTFKFTR